MTTWRISAESLTRQNAHKPRSAKGRNGACVTIRRELAGGSVGPGAGAGIAALEGAALILGEASPDAGVLAAL